MNNNRKFDKEKTQEIKLPKSRTDYNDNFDGYDNTLKSSKKESDSTTNLNFFKNLNKKKILVISLICFLMILIIGVGVFVALNINYTSTDISSTAPSNPKLEKIVSKSTTIQPSTQIEYTYEEIVEKNTFIEESTDSTEKESTKPTETQQETTKEISETQKETSENITEPKETEIFQSLSVGNIFVAKATDSTFVVNINGEFKGYTPEEVLSKVAISTSSGTPKTSYPNLSEDSFSFNIDLSDCSGTLNISLDNYNFYQSISSFSQ